VDVSSTCVTICHNEYGQRDSKTAIGQSRVFASERPTFQIISTSTQCIRIQECTVWVENVKVSNFSESKNFIYFEIFVSIKFRVPTKGSHMIIICGARGGAENCSKKAPSIKVMAAFYSIDSALRGYNAYLQ
jgi:hypothetical protein